MQIRMAFCFVEFMMRFFFLMMNKYYVHIFKLTLAMKNVAACKKFNMILNIVI